MAAEEHHRHDEAGGHELHRRNVPWAATGERGPDGSDDCRRSDTLSTDANLLDLPVVNAGGTVAPTDVRAFSEVSNDLQNRTLLTTPMATVATYPGRTVATSASGTSIANSAYVRVKIVFTGGTAPTAIINAGVNIFNFST